MTVDWGRYELYVPSHYGPSSDLTRADARARYDEVMSSKPHRLDELTRLVAQDSLALEHSDASISRLDDWFVENALEDPDSPGRLTAVSYTLAHDIALFLGDVMITRAPRLHWEFYTAGKRSVEYQQHVVAGFPTYPDDCDDIDRGVVGYGIRIIQGRPNPGGYFLPHITTVLERA